MGSGNFGLGLDQRLLPSIARSQRFLDSLLQAMRCAVPAIVQSFSAGPPATVSVVIATNELVTKALDDDPFSVQSEALQIPVLTDVPILIPSAGGFSFTVPITQGDEVLLVFSDTEIDSWLQSGGMNNHPTSQRRHNLSDAVAIVGLRSAPRALSSYSTTSAQVRSDDGTVVIDLKPDQISVTAPTVLVTGSTTVTISGNNTTSIDGKDFLLHKHSGVAAGLATTGPVV